MNNKKLLVILNIILIGAVAMLVMNEREASITGYAVKEGRSALVNYIVFYNTEDITTGETFKQYVRDREVFFATEKMEIDPERLQEIGSDTLQSLDVDGLGDECSHSVYTITNYRYDINGDGDFDRTEPLIYGSVTDSDGCVAAILPEDTYELILA